MRRLRLLLFFVIATSHAELVSASPAITETLVSASIAVHHEYCVSDVSATEGHAEFISASSKFNATHNLKLNIEKSFNFKNNISLKDSLKSAMRDSIKADTVYHHYFKKATILSACIPGAGQIYNEFGYRKIQDKKNRAWWKVPIIYGLLGTAGYYFHQYTVTSKRLKDEWIFRNDSLGTNLYEEYVDWDADELIGGTDVYVYDNAGNPVLDKNGNQVSKHLLGFDDAAKRRDLLIFGFAAIWGLQVVEALVDAHFVNFDVSEDLTFSWSPTMLSYNAPGVTLRLGFD